MDAETSALLKALVEGQVRQDAAITRLALGLDELRQAQQHTEGTVQQFVGRMDKLIDRTDRIAESLDRAEATIARLADRQDRAEAQLTRTAELMNMLAGEVRHVGERMGQLGQHMENYGQAVMRGFSEAVKRNGDLAVKVEALDARVAVLERDRQ